MLNLKKTTLRDIAAHKLTEFRPLGYEKMYLPLYQVADTPFHILGDVI